MNMIEKVARAICVKREGYSIDVRVTPWKKYMPEARAAIAAMREPTDDMFRRGYENYEGDNPLRHAYKAMIDAALEKENE